LYNFFIFLYRIIYSDIFSHHPLFQVNTKLYLHQNQGLQVTWLKHTYSNPRQMSLVLY